MLKALLVIVALLGAETFAAPRYPRARVNVEIPDRVKPLLLNTTPSPIVQLRTLATMDVAPTTTFTRIVVLPDSPTAQQLFDYAMTTAARSREVKSTNPNLSKQEMVFAIKTFKALVENDTHRDFQQRDAALFYYGHLLQAAKYLKEARQLFDKLIKEHPGSPFVAPAVIVVADYELEMTRFLEAEALYRRALSSPKSALHAYANYKLAWVHIHELRYPDALEAMHRAVTLTRGEQTPLALAARTDYMLAYAEAGPANKALVALKAVDPARALELYQQLAARYVARGVLDRAVFVYQDLLVQVPAKACAWQTQIARAMMTMHGWQSSARTAIDAVVKLAETSNDPECRATGAAMRSIEMRRYLAETAYAHGSYEVAATLFADLASDRNTPKPLALDAAVASVLAYKSLLGIDPDLAVLAKRSSKRKSALSTLETAMLEAHALYAALVDDTDTDPELATMRFVEAATLRGHGDHEGAIPLLMDYLRVNPENIHALRMLGDSRESMTSSPHEKSRGARNRSGR